MRLLSKNLGAIYGNRFLIQTGFAVITVFLPTFFYLEFGKSLATVVAIYIAAFALHGLLTPLTAKLISRIGMRTNMIIALVPFLLLALTALAFWDLAPSVAVGVFIVSWAVYRALYWVPYHVEVTTFLDQCHRGRQVSFFTNAVSAALVFAPLAGGFLIENFSFSYAFALSIALMIASLVPLMFMRESHEEYSFGYLETFQKLFSKKNRTLLIAFAGDGAQNIVNVIFWPVFIYLIMNGDFAAVGIVSALVVLATLVLRFFAGEFIDKANKQHILLISSIIYTTGWFLKIFTQSAVQIFLFDAYHQAGRAVHRVSFDAGTYEQSADNGHYVDEFTALKEIAMNIGRILMLALGGLLAAVVGIQIAFFLAAGASLLMVLLNRGIKVAV